MAEKTIVLKAGGVVVGRKKPLTTLAEVIAGYRKAGERVVLVVSAPDKATDLLKTVAMSVGSSDLDAAIDKVEARYRAWLDELDFGQTVEALLAPDFALLRKLGRELSPSCETADRFLAFGEIMSVKVIAAFLRVHGTSVESYDASRNGMITNDIFGNADPVPDARRTLRNDLELALLHDQVAVVTGFIGRTVDGRVTTLGRGGSDYTATFLAEVMRADRVEIWKETPLRRTDPRLVPATPPIPALTYEEAAELAAAGMKAIHPRAIGPVRRAGIVVWVRDVNAPDQLGTRIGHSVVSGIAVVRRTCWVSLASEDMCDVPGFLARVAKALSDQGIDIGVAATGDVRISFTLSIADLEAAFERALEGLRTFAVVVTRRDSAVLSVVAPAVGPQLLSEIGQSLAAAHVALRGASMAGSVDGDTTEPPSCQLVIADSDVEAAVRALHTAFFEL